MATANPKAVWFQLCQAVFNGVNNLALVDDAGNAFTGYLQKWPISTGLKLPAYQVCPAGKEKISSSGYESIEIVYPVLLLILRPCNADPTLKNEELYWREQAILKFIALPQTITGNQGQTDAWDCDIETTEYPDAAKIQGNENLDYLAMLYSFTTERDRLRGG